MTKIILAILVLVEVLLFALMIYFLSGVSILLPGLGLIISGGLIAAILFVVELILIAATIFLYRRIRLD